MHAKQSGGRKRKIGGGNPELGRRGIKRVEVGGKTDGGEGGGEVA